MSQNKFLKECMADALIALMKKKDFSKITINEIAKTAGVNRSTWFRNFDSKTEALTFKITNLWFKWADEHNLSTCPKYTIENAGDFFMFCYKNRKLLELILNLGLQSVIYDAFYQIMMPQFEANATECYQSRYYSYAIFGLLGEWIRRKYFETPDEMVKIFHKITKNDIK